MSLSVCPSAFIRVRVRRCGCPLLSMYWMVAGVGGHHESRRERHTIGKVAVHGGAGNPEHPRDVGGRDAPGAYERRTPGAGCLGGESSGIEGAVE
jgi:hypothetical protein